MPLLSLCIPTYQRAALLEESLYSILRQMDTVVCALVEIVVSDNASSDSTVKVVQAIQRQHPEVNLYYFCQEENIGADANIYSALQRGIGKFLLAFSDDDILLEGALLRILEVIRHNPDLDGIYLNSGSFLTDSRNLRVLSSNVKEDLLITNPNDCLTRISSGFTFLSAFAIRRTRIAGRDYSSRIGSNIIQTYLFLDALASASQILLLAHPLIGVRENNSGGYSYFQVFVTNFLAALKYAEQSGYARVAVRTTRVTHLRKCLFPFVRDAKINGRLGQSDFWDGARRMLNAYGPDPFLLFVALPLMLLPTRLLYALRNVYKLFDKQLHPA